MKELLALRGIITVDALDLPGGCGETFKGRSGPGWRGSWCRPWPRRWTGSAPRNAAAWWRQYWNRPLESEDRYEREVRALDALGPGFLMLQDLDLRGYGLPVTLIARLFEEVASFRCLKVEVVPAGVKYTEVLQATGGRLHVSGGWAVMQRIEALDRGVHVLMPTGPHELYVRIDRQYRGGRREEARALFERLLPLDISIRFFKRLLWRQGIYATPRVREPILPFDAVHERLADEHIERVLALMREVSGARPGG